jgi:hypothetical protein
MAASISHLYRDESISPPLTGIYLSIPSLLSPEVVPAEYNDQYLSRDQNQNAPILNKSALKLFRGTSKHCFISVLRPLSWTYMAMTNIFF